MKCCICGKEIDGRWGNNPTPVRKLGNVDFEIDEQCCNDCDNKIVTPIRIALGVKNLHKAYELQEQAYNLQKEASK